MNRFNAFAATTLLALGLSAGAALAETGPASMTVSLAGKDPATIATDIRAAARRVCMAELGPLPLGAEEMSTCVSLAASRAFDTIAQAQAAFAARTEQVATAGRTR